MIEGLIRIEDAVMAFHYCVDGGNLNDLWPKSSSSLVEVISKDPGHVIIESSNENPTVLQAPEPDSNNITSELESIDFDSIESLFEL